MVRVLVSIPCNQKEIFEVLSQVLLSPADYPFPVGVLRLLCDRHLGHLPAAGHLLCGVPVP